MGEVEHVGSTAVPGLDATPVLDLQAPVVDLACAVEVAEDRRTRHLHLLVSGSPRWREQPAFRDALRADTTSATRYGQLERALAAEHPDDREAYTEGKAGLVRAALDEASPSEHP